MLKTALMTAAAATSFLIAPMAIAQDTQPTEPTPTEQPAPAPAEPMPSDEPAPTSTPADEPTSQPAPEPAPSEEPNPEAA